MYEQDFSQEVGAARTEVGSNFSNLLKEMYSESGLTMPKSDSSSSTSFDFSDLELVDSVSNEDDVEPEVTGEKNSVETEPLERSEVPEDEDTDPVGSGEPNSIETERLERSEVPADEDSEPVSSGEPNSIETERLERSEVPADEDTEPDVSGEANSVGPAHGTVNGAEPEGKKPNVLDGLADSVSLPELKRLLQSHIQERLADILNTEGKRGAGAGVLDPSELKKHGGDIRGKLEPELRRQLESLIPESRQPETGRPHTSPQVESAPPHTQR